MTRCPHGCGDSLDCRDCFDIELAKNQAVAASQQLSDESRNAVIRTMIPEKEWTAAQHIEAAEHHMLEARKILSRIR